MFTCNKLFNLTSVCLWLLWFIGITWCKIARYTSWAKKLDCFYKFVTFIYVNIVLHSIYQTVCFFIQCKTGVLYITVFRYLCAILVWRHCAKITTNFIDGFYLHAFRLKFTINANIIYIPVESKVNMSILCPKRHG